MHQCQDRASGEADILEAEPDIKEHEKGRYDNRYHGLGPHLAADGRSDVLALNVLGGHTEMFLQSSLQFLPLLQFQGPCLDDDLIGSVHLLGLNVIVPGHFRNHRHNLLVNLIDGVIPVKGYRSGSASHKFQAVIQLPVASGRENCHADKSGHDDHAGDREENLPMSHEIKVRNLPGLAVKFFLPHTHRIESIHEDPRDDQSGKHGQDHTERQRDGKSFDRSGTEDSQDCRCDQRGNISV